MLLSEGWPSFKFLKKFSSLQGNSEGLWFSFSHRRLTSNAIGSCTRTMIWSTPASPPVKSLGTRTGGLFEWPSQALERCYWDTAAGEPSRANFSSCAIYPVWITEHTYWILNFQTQFHFSKTCFSFCVVQFSTLRGRGFFVVFFFF